MALIIVWMVELEGVGLLTLSRRYDAHGLVVVRAEGLLMLKLRPAERGGLHFNLKAQGRGRRGRIGADDDLGVRLFPLVLELAFGKEGPHIVDRGP